MKEDEGTIEQLATSGTLLFEKARLDYCLRSLKREDDRTNTLDKKSEFYTSFMMILVGAFFLNIDIVRDIKLIVHSADGGGFSGLGVDIVVIVPGVLLLVAIFSVLMSHRIRGFKSEYPDDFVAALFSPSTQFFSRKEELDLVVAVARSCAIAIEGNIGVNRKKAWWLSVCNTCIALEIASLFFLISVIYSIK